MLIFIGPVHTIWIVAVEPEGPGQDTSFYTGKSQKPVGILHAGEVRSVIHPAPE